MKEDLPLISIVVPTYNEERNIDKCLSSIFNQNYPKDKMEVIVVDDCSIDRTVEIARRYGVKVIKHDNRHGEIGKMIGFKEATGKYALYLDADIELKKRNWFQKMIKPMEEDKNIIGSFTRYFSKKSDSPLERFYSLDPLQRDTIYQFFSPSIEKTVMEKRSTYYLCMYEVKKIPPTGLCLYRRKELMETVRGYSMFLELDFLVLLVRRGYKYFAYVKTAGLYHHHVNNIKELIRKRKYNVQQVYLKTYSKRLYRWFDLYKPKDLMKILMIILYSNLVIPGILYGLYKTIKHKDLSGMYEPVVSIVVANTVIFSFLTSSLFYTVFKR